MSHSKPWSGDRDQRRDEQEYVRFFLGARYYYIGEKSCNHMSRDTCKRILQLCFDMSHLESDGLMDSCTDGFEIECRLDQFARFIIERHRHGNCMNGIKDLRPGIVYCEKHKEPPRRINVVDRLHQRCFSV